jgi:hypothetical protein
MQSLCALMHYDFNQPREYSYEQAIQAMNQLRLPNKQIEEQFRRTVFNVIARNQDDHVKNIAFLMNRDGIRTNADNTQTRRSVLKRSARRTQHLLVTILAPLLRTQELVLFG